nr:hypothetical protein CFP56_24212 [Quercus suber]
MGKPPSEQMSSHVHKLIQDKQIYEALIKVKKAGFKAVDKFKASDGFSNKLYEYYLDGFELFRKYLAKHHPELDLS